MPLWMRDTCVMSCKDLTARLRRVHILLQTFSRLEHAYGFNGTRRHPNGLRTRQALGPICCHWRFSQADFQCDEHGLSRAFSRCQSEAGAGLSSRNLAMDLLVRGALFAIHSREPYWAHQFRCGFGMG